MAPRASGSHPWNCLEKLAALVPLPRVHLVRYGGCLAPHSPLRAAIIPTPRQQGMEESRQRGRRAGIGRGCSSGCLPWTWRAVRFVQQGTLRIIAAITQGAVIRKILQHLKLAVDPPPIAPARVRQETFAWSLA